MTKKFNRGFTLIELLVVIAIIGILSSVVLASLNTARGKGANAAVKSNLANLRAQGEIVYDNNGTGLYTGICADPVFARGVAAAGSAGGTTATCNLASPASAWAVSAALKITEPNPAGGTFSYWCVDNTGNSKGEAAALGAATVCA